jgi:hypothetical protein
MSKPRGFHLLVAVVLGLAVPALCGAQRPLGPPFQVNVESAGLRAPASLAMNARGEFVVAWVNVPVDGTEPRTIVARRFAADGMPVTDEIQVAGFPADNHPAEVVIREDGSFIVVFPVFPDLLARHYGPDGTFEGESVVARGLQRGSYAVAARPDGGFALVWSREPRGLVAQVIGAEGEPAGPERRVGRGDGPAVAVGPDGDFVVAWIVAQAIPGQSHLADYYLFARRFGANGAPSGDRIAVQARLRGILHSPRVAVDQQGDFLVLWQAAGVLGIGEGRPFEEGAVARRFAADGTPRTGLLRVAGREAQSAQLAMDRAGNFVVAWSSASDASPGIFARRFTADGPPFRPALQVDARGSAGPLVASDANGNFVVVWSGIGREILAQRYRKR